MTPDVETLPAVLDEAHEEPAEGGRLAVWSLVLGILSLILGGIILGVPALITGYRARRIIANGGHGSPSQAMAGIVLGWISSGLTALGSSEC